MSTVQYRPATAERRLPPALLRTVGLQSSGSREKVMAMQGQVALVIIGRDGVGCEQARRLAGQGVSLALHYNTQARKDITIRLHDELTRAGRRASIHTGDLGSAQSIERMFDSVLAEHHRIDLVVNAVGSILKKHSAAITEAEQLKMFAYNVFVDEQRRIWTDKYQENVLKGPRS
ncbi:Hypothetical protein R9X50_00532100 [Acrodontium crateriforme]|uniref:SDR family NAD(P)-dependent oxidoreductase n=1 Tax=Acrodontium crateriforme TaxID=150365 RepID=A0AAQ3M5W1_9PEZI|nr:Hypothetical protein R9X50_00532100 [Acrodontium crateriforme]